MENEQFKEIIKILNSIDASLEKLTKCIREDSWGRSYFQIEIKSDK